MARARMLKPGFFKNEDLAVLDPYAQLLFAGLWTLADKKGRLEDRPARIKAELFPYKGVPVEKHLNTLADAHFLVRYEVEGAHYIQIVAFEKHQHPHPHEPESQIPPCNYMSLHEAAEPDNAKPSRAESESESSPSESLTESESVYASRDKSRAEPTDPPDQETISLRREWENRIGILPLAVIQEFDEYARFVPREWFLKAIEVTKAEAERPSWKYCLAVLKGASERNEPPQLRAEARKVGSVADALAMRKANGRR